MAKVISEIEAELRKATGLKPKVAEKRQDFLVRLADKATQFDADDTEKSDEVWGSLSKPAQSWANKANKAHSKDAEIVDFETDELKAEAAEEDAAPVKKGKAAKAEKAPKAEKAKAPKVGKAVNRTIMDIMWEDMTLGTEAILAKLSKKNITTTPGNVNVVRAQFRASVKFLAEAEALKQQPTL